MTILLVIALVAVAFGIGFRVGIHGAMLGIERGARQRLSADEYRQFDALMDTALYRGEE